MFDAAFIPVVARVLTPWAMFLHRRGVLANQVTIAGFLIGLGAIPALVFDGQAAALAFIAVNRVLDGLDGAVARLQGPSNRGAFLDIALDFAFYAAVVLGFALKDPAQNALAAATLLATFIGTGSSFLAFSVMAERTGLKSDAYRGKGIFYLGGLTEGAETIGIFALMCIWPAGFPYLAYGFSVACLITTVTRLVEGYRRF